MSCDIWPFNRQISDQCHLKEPCDNRSEGAKKSRPFCRKGKFRSPTQRQAIVPAIITFIPKDALITTLCTFMVGPRRAGGPLFTDSKVYGKKIMVESINNHLDAIIKKGETYMEIVHLDNHLMIVNKPSGLPSQPDESRDPSLIDLAKDHIRRRFQKPGNVYLALLHRLDRPTSGLVALARTDKAAKRMSEAIRSRQFEKTYLALVETHSSAPKSGELINYIVRSGKSGMRVERKKSGQGKEARLIYDTLARTVNRDRALLEVKIETGVKHQIRCQLAHIGLPIVGDFRYGDRQDGPRPETVDGGRAILLHAWKLSFIHPVRREPLDLRADPPGHWRPYLAAFPEGAPDA